jgi:hypothetical protein
MSTDREHLDAAMQWLCRAQDVTGSGGISGSYVLKQGWKSPYPETTGYIIPTFIRYSEFTGNDVYLERAIRMGDWERKIQLPSGAVRGGMGLSDKPMVFDTGQVIIGWAELHKKTGEDKYLDAAILASDWLVKNQDDDGKWGKHVFQDIPHTYHSRVSWPILLVHDLTGQPKYMQAAERNISWILNQARDDGWICNMGFTTEQAPFTHTIAYTLRGLFESSGMVTKFMKDRIMPLVNTASDKIIDVFRLDTSPVFLPGTINCKWKSRDRYSCMTGNAQFAILFLKMHLQNKSARYLDAGLNLIESVKSVQDLSSANPGILGAVPGSHPIKYRYQKNTYPNWATKFLADALMLKGEMQ